MARPRSPAAILEMRGAFETHPERKREDAEGGDVFQPEPPAHLPQDHVRAWRYLVDRLPRVAVYNTDEFALEVMAGLVSEYWHDRKDLKVIAELRQWVAKLGFSPVDRTKLANDHSKKPANKFKRPQDPPEG